MTYAPARPARIARPATARQVAFIATLAAERGVVVPVVETGAQASAAIDALLAMPKPARKAAGAVAQASAAVLVPGYYAITYGGALRFYRVVDGKGRWLGRQFINRYKSDDLVRIPRAEEAAVRAEVATNGQAAREAFARETTHCWRCGRRLTDLPLAAKNGGLGPECAKMV